MTKKKLPLPVKTIDTVDTPRHSWVAPAKDTHYIHLTLEQRDSIHELMMRGWMPQYNTLSHMLLKQSVQILARAHESGCKCWFNIEPDGTIHS